MSKPLSPSAVTPQIDKRALASLYQRFCGLLIDMAFMVPCALAIGLVGYCLRQCALKPDDKGWIDCITFGLMVVLPSIYPMYALASVRQATFGMRVMKIKLITSKGTRPTLRDTSERTNIALLSGFLTLGFFWAALDPKRRTLHDLMSGTLVVRADFDQASHVD